jgi:type I restriction enzyme S subunit
LIEALIEGKVTEAELVNAQEALERGDKTADRALLSRLTRKGVDVSGEPPLFPDLDALYALLAQTEPATE